MASTATCLSSSGPSVSGKPWPRLTEPVAAASSDMVAKIVAVANGRRRRVRYSSPAGTATIVPTTFSGRLSSYRTVLSIANYNMHCGMDGWGRPYDYVAAIESLEADIIVIEESWTTEGEDEGQAERAAAHLGYQVITHELGQGRRIRPQPEADDELDRLAAVDPTEPGALPGRRAGDPAEVQEMPRWQEAEPGRWGIAMLVRPDWSVEATRVLPLRLLKADRVRRAALVVDLTIEGMPVSVAGTHMSHLHYGSHRNWADLRRLLREGARPDAVLAGDMNTWGPLVRRFMPGWHRAVKGATWPAWRPHSQIDHILVRGRLRAISGTVCPASGSDHRPVRATLEL